MRGRARSRVPVAAAVAVLMAVSVGLTGCTGSGLITVRRCLPAPLQVAPAVVAPGETITVSSGAADCDLGYTPGHTYTLAVQMPQHRSPESRVEVGTDGRFTAEVTVPSDFLAGDAAVVVHGSAFDECDDGGGSCAGYTAAFTVR